MHSTNERLRIYQIGIDLNSLRKKKGSLHATLSKTAGHLRAGTNSVSLLIKKGIRQKEFDTCSSVSILYPDVQSVGTC